MFWVMTLVRSTYSPIKNIVRMDIVLKAFFERRATSLNRIVSELKIKMIKINTINEIFKINIFKLVNKSIKDEIKIVIPSKSKNKNIFIFNSLISNKLIGVFLIAAIPGSLLIILFFKIINKFQDSTTFNYNTIFWTSNWEFNNTKNHINYYYIFIYEKFTFSMFRMDSSMDNNIKLLITCPCLIPSENYMTCLSKKQKNTDTSRHEAPFESLEP